ncbi:MAG: tetratricopeptide repeat protein [Pseudomonadota bacterium]
MTETFDTREYFISYNSQDRAFAQALSTALDDADISHYFAGRDMGLGGNIPIWMDRALTASTRVIALCSPDYFKPEAPYSEVERAAAFWADIDGAQGKLVPVTIRACDYSSLYAPLARIDVNGMTQGAAIAQILADLTSDTQRRRHEGQRRADAHPDVFRVGRPRLPGFTGRTADLTALHQALSRGQNAAVTQAISGLGGIGKTTLAAEYAHRFGTKGRYGGVWWVNAEGGVQQGLADLAPVWNALNIGEPIPQPESLPDQARAVLSWLGARPTPWLVIYDNVPDPDSVRDWLPAGSARVLITSRHQDFGDLAQTQSLDKWDIETSVKFLLDETGRNDRAGAEALAEKLDGLPLALDQAAAFLRKGGVPFGTYIDRLQDMLKRPRIAGAAGNYPDTVYASLLISVEALSQPARDLMCLLSWLSPDGADVNLIVQCAIDAPEFIPDPLGEKLRDEIERGDLIAETQTASLLRLGEDLLAGQTLITHRVVQSVLREWQTEEGIEGWDAYATGMVNAVFPQNPTQPSTWELAARLLPHAVELAQHGPRQGEPGRNLGRLLNQAGTFRYARGDTDGAIALMEPNVELARETHGERSEVFCTRLSNLSGRYTDAGRYDEAERGFLTVLEIEEDLLGPEHPKIAIRLNNLGEVYWKQQQFDKAEPLFVRALQIGKLQENDGTYDVAGGLNALGALYDDWAEQPGQAHRRQQAQDLKEQAIETARKALGERHPDVSQYLHNLAILFARMDDFRRAADLEFRAVAIMVSLGLMEHPYTTQRIEHLSLFWDRSGQGDRKDRLMEFLGPEILAVETAMMESVQEDPDNRHFGPQSWVVQNRHLFENADA